MTRPQYCAFPGAAGVRGGGGPPEGNERVESVNLRDLVYRLYARRVEGRLDHDQVPKHIGVILDGNRRWAKAVGPQPRAGPPGRRQQDPGAARLVRRDGRRGRHPLAALHRQPGPPRGPADPAARHHRGRGAGPGGGRPLARAPRRQRGPAARAHAGRPQGGRAGHRTTSTGYWSTSPWATAAARRSRTRCARCCSSTRRRAPPSRSSPRSSTSSTSPSTSTRGASPTPTS